MAEEQTERIRLTVPRVLELMREAVAERVAEHGEDYRYTGVLNAPGSGTTGIGCNYVHTPEMDRREPDSGLKCGCLIGEVLHRAGLELEFLHSFERRGSLAIKDLASTVPFLERVDATRPAIELMSAAQSRQDAGTPWARVLSNVEKLYGEVRDDG